MTHISFDTAEAALAFTSSQLSPMRVVLVPDDRAFGHFWVVSL
jgi:hypothetical protein